METSYKANEYYERQGTYMIHNCCKNCNNNPANNPNASGVCLCALPSMEMSTPGTVEYPYITNCSSTTFNTNAEGDLKCTNAFTVAPNL